MNKKILMLFLIIMVINSSCNDNQTNEYIYPILSGKIKNYEGEKVFLANKLDYSIKHSIKVDREGNFEDTIKVRKGIYDIRIGSQKTLLYLDNGYLLNIKADLEGLDNSMIINGKGESENKFIRTKEHKIIEFTKTNRDKLYTLNETEFNIKWKLLISSLNDLLKKNNKLNDAFRNQQKKILEYEYLKSLSLYESYHGYYTNQDNFTVSDGFLSKLKNVNYEIGGYYNISSAYKTLVNNHFNYQAKKIADKDSISLELARIKTYANIKDSIIKNSFLEGSILDITFIKNIDEYHKAFLEASNNEKLREKINSYYNSLKKVDNGEPSPKFYNYENFAGATTSLDDLKGQYI